MLLVYAVSMAGWGLVCSRTSWAPPFPLMPEQASLFRSGVPFDSLLEGHSLWDLALLTSGLAREISTLFDLALGHRHAGHHEF